MRPQVPLPGRSVQPARAECPLLLGASVPGKLTKERLFYARQSDGEDVRCCRLLHGTINVCGVPLITVLRKEARAS